jgi:hypothetical protein
MIAAARSTIERDADKTLTATMEMVLVPFLFPHLHLIMILAE